MELTTEQIKRIAHVLSVSLSDQYPNAEFIFKVKEKDVQNLATEEHPN